MEDCSDALNREVLLPMFNLVVDFDVLTTPLEIWTKQELSPKVERLLISLPISSERPLT